MQQLDIEKIKSGDKEELKEMFEVLFPRLRLLARRYLAAASDVDVDDLVQDALIRIYSNINKFNGENASFFHWCIQVAKNVMVDHLRRELPKRRMEMEDRKNLDEVESRENVDLQRLIQESISTLPDTERLILLKHMEGQTLEEIAKELGKSKSQVARLQQNAVKTLQLLILGEPTNASGG